MQKFRPNRNSNMRYTSDSEAPGSIKKQILNKHVLSSIEAPKDSYGNIQKLQLNSPQSAQVGNFISFRNASHLQASQQKSKGESFTLLTQAQNLRRITPTTAGSTHQKIAGGFMQHTAASKQKLNLEKSAGKYNQGHANPQVSEVKKIASIGTTGAQITVQPVKSVAQRASRQSNASESKYVPIKTQQKLRQQNERKAYSRQNSDIYEDANRTISLNQSITNSSGLRSKSSFLKSANKSKTQALLNKTPVTPTSVDKNITGQFNAYKSSTGTRGDLHKKASFRSTSQRQGKETSTPNIQPQSKIYGQERSYLSRKVSMMSQNYFKSIEKERNNKRSMKNVGNYRTQYMAQDSNGASIVTSSQPSDRLNSIMGSTGKQWNQTEAAEKQRDQEQRKKRMELGREYLQANRSNSRAALQRQKQNINVTPSKTKADHIGSVEIELDQEQSSKQEMKQKLRFLYAKLGAVIKGYKARRIYHNNKAIRKYRYEFRDLIQFAYSLKQDISYLQNQRNSEVQVEQTKSLLLTSLKDLVQKRLQFMNHFDKLFHGFGSPTKHEQSHSASCYSSVRSCKPTTEWLVESKPRFIQIGGLAHNSSQNTLNHNSVQSLHQSSSPMTPARQLRMSNYKKQFINASKEGIDLQASIYKEESNNRPSVQNNKTRVNKYLTFGVNTGASISRNNSQVKNLIANNLSNESNESAVNIQDQEAQEVLRKSQMSIKSNEKHQVSRFRTENVSHGRSGQPINNGLRHEKSQELFNQVPLQTYNSMISKNITKSYQMLNVEECRDQLLDEQRQLEISKQESPQEKREFLKKGQGQRSTSRITYDPRKSIMEEQFKKKVVQEQPTAVENEQSKSLTRNNSKSATRVNPRQCQEPEQQQMPQRRLERQVNQIEKKSLPVPLFNQKDNQKRSSSFVSKIPRLSKSIQRDHQKPSQAPQNNQDELKQELSVPRLKPMKSESNLKNVKSRYMGWATPTKKDDDLRNINDKIRASNQNYIVNKLSNKSSANKSFSRSANQEKETSAVPQPTQHQSQVTKFLSYEQNEDKIEINDHQHERTSGQRMRSRQGSNNSRLIAGHPVPVNTRYHKKTFSNVSGLSQLIQPEESEVEEKTEELKVKQHSRRSRSPKKLASPVRHQMLGMSPKRLEKACESPGPQFYQGGSDSGSDVSPSKRLQQIIARFSPLKTANFENQYIAKRNNKSVGATAKAPVNMPAKVHTQVAKVTQEKGFTDFQTLLNQKKQQRELDQAMNGVKKVSSGISALSPMKGFVRQREPLILDSPQKSDNDVQDYQSPKRMQITSLCDMSNHSPSVTSPNVQRGDCHPESPDKSSAYGDQLGKLGKKLEMIVCDGFDRNRPQIAEIDMFDQSKRCLNLALSSGFNSCHNGMVLSSALSKQNVTFNENKSTHFKSLSGQQPPATIHAFLKTDDLQETHSSFRLKPQTINASSSQYRSGHYSTQEIPQFLQSGPHHNELTEMISPSIMNPMCSESPTKAQNTPMNARKQDRECIEGTPLVSNPHIIYPGQQSDVDKTAKDRRRSRGDRTKSQQKGTATATRSHIQNTSSHQISQFTEITEDKVTPMRSNTKGHPKVLSNAFQVKHPSVLSNGPYVPVMQQQTPNRYTASSAKKSGGHTASITKDSYSAQRLLRTQQRLNQQKKSQPSAEKAQPAQSAPSNTAAQIQSAIDVLVKQKNEGNMAGLDAIIQTLQTQMKQLENQ